MFTKAELLEKGISDEVADEIIAAASEDEGSENSLQALEKAISEPETGELFKAKGGKEKGEDEDEDDEDSDYDESYMKKYMKRYMKENKKACGKMAKEAGIFSGNMEKAAEIDMDAEGAIVEMADLKPILEEQGEFNSRMAKAIETLAEQITYISDQQEKSFDLMQKAAAVQVETAKGMGEFMSVPQGRKGVTASVEMQKGVQYTPEMVKVAYTVLMKAVQNKDEKAGMIISAFESSGKRLDRLNSVQRQYINDLIQKEGK